MSGYIEYNSSSELSPEYPYPTEILGTVYNSPAAAIEAGHDPLVVLKQHVAMHRNLYYQYRNYEFKGNYSDYLNEALKFLYTPRLEPVTVGKYVAFLTEWRFPLELTIPVRRNVYTIAPDPEKEGLYEQVFALPYLEDYNMGLIDGVPIYIGVKGAFLLLDSKEQDISHILEKLRG